ncbi:alpha-ketoglutarate permease [Ditylenchus destructor]|uniref:Alpha-ketoglutarate permease n=1 Tax=Ditylenchus destructor TaxID=166010 RepID=A0AAD4QWK4_9BILA|nr:alpha-ketoglutarate permease [Ditylenchus destructor]
MNENSGEAGTPSVSNRSWADRRAIWSSGMTGMPMPPSPSISLRISSPRRSDHPAAEHRRGVRGRLPDAADRRLADGVYADKYGRKAGLTLSVSLMCAGSLLIAVTPGYETIGALRLRARVRSPDAGAVDRRRIWRQRDLSVGDGGQEAPRLLFPASNMSPLYLGPAHRARRAADPAGVDERGGAGELGGGESPSSSAARWP